MPGPLIAGDELHQLAITPQQKMCRDAQIAQAGIKRMRGHIECIGEQTLDIRPAKLVRRQADIVQNDHVDRHAGRAGIAVGAGDTPHPCYPTVLIHAHDIRVIH